MKAVELKCNNDRVTAHQKDNHKALELAGLKVEIVRVFDKSLLGLRYVSTRLTSDTAKVLAKLASTEHRTVSAMMRLLVEEALRARGK